MSLSRRFFLPFAALALVRAKTARAENAEKEYTPVYRKSMDKK